MDAGTVRTGLLEMMQSKGLIRKADFKVLNPIDFEFFPYETSTRLYPEFPFAKLSHVNPRDGQKVLIALLAIQESDKAAKAGRYARWSIPQQYSDVINLMQELELEPFIKKVGVLKFFRANPLFGASITGLIGLLVSFLVIREMKNRVIYAEKQRLGVTLRSIGDGVITTDTKGNIVLLNKIAEELTGWSIAEAFGRPVTEVLKTIDEKSGNPCENPVHKVLESGKTIGMAKHTALIAKDGSHLSIADSGAPILDSGKKVIGVVLVFRDVSELKQTEEQRERDALRTKILLDLHKNAPLLQGKELYGYALERAVKLTESTVGYIHEIEEVGGEPTIVLTQWNKEGLKLFTASYDTHYPLNQAGVWAGSIHLKEPVIHNDYQNSLEKQGYPEDHFPVIRHMDIPVIDDGKVKLVFGVGNKKSDYNENDIVQIQLIANELQKIVAQKRFSIEQKQLESQLRQAQKMEAIGLMAGGVAHDLNNILSGIVAYPELLLLQLPQDSELRDPIEEIQASGNRAAAVVSDLLTVARGAASTREPYNLNVITREYLDSPECQKLKMSNQKVMYDEQLEAEYPLISCSPVHIKKILMNLVMNAAEAIDDAGNIFITTSNQFVDESASVELAMKAGHYVVLSIRDTGAGIASKDLAHIFEPFYTKKIMGKSGTGLGLAVVWNVVQDHNGKIFVESDNKGTSFRVYLPVTEEKNVSSIKNEQANDLFGHGEHILVVDDEPQLRDIASQILRALSYTVDSVCSGELAIEFVKEAPVDLIVIDMLMEPDMNGRQTYEEIIKMYPDQKAIVASGFSESADVKATLKLGARGFISKPYSMDKLGRAVKNVLSN